VLTSQENTVSEDTYKVKKTEPGAALSEKDLNKVTGGTGGTKER
jgi:bacteriocin-like protein